LKSIVRVDEQREGIIADMQSRIDIRGGIIDDLSKVDKNSQTIDLRGQEISAVWRGQHDDDKRMIADLQQDLDSCRSNQKWIALISGLGGSYVGYKIRGAGQIQNPFANFGQAAFAPNPIVYSAEDKMREALRRVSKQ
jgi:hypothetical protein